jgi:hypothetical protein
MTERLEQIDGSNWEDFLDGELTVLVLARTDCDACDESPEQLQEFLAEDEEWQDADFGKMFIDKPGLASFKKESPWLKDVRNLPYTAIYVDGEIEKEFAGSGISRLTNRLERVTA